MVKKGCKTPLYDAVRSYGWDAFALEVLDEGTVEEIAEKEIALIASDPDCYNLHLGGSIGFDNRLKGPEATAVWRERMRVARVGRKPALGMRHSAENKKLFSEVSNKYWADKFKYDSIADEIFKHGQVEAKRLYGISKTHYHRMRKRLGIPKKGHQKK